MRSFLFHIAVILITVLPAFADSSDQKEGTKESGVSSETSFEVKWEVYPNPMEEYVYIDIKNIKGGNTLSFLSVKNSIGKEVKSVPLSGEKSVRLHVQKLNAGVYYFSIYSSGKVIDVKRVIKNH